MDWIDVTQEMDQLKALVNTVMNFLLYRSLESCPVGAEGAVSQEGFSSLEVGLEIRFVILFTVGVSFLLRVYEIKSLDKPSFATSIVRALFHHLKMAFDRGRNML
jgi:hypothetical protein